MKQAKGSKFLWITGLSMAGFVILAFGTAAIVQPHRVERYFKPTVILHIILSMGWLFLFIYQSRLVLKGEIDRHRKNALLGMLLVPLIAIEAIYITWAWGDPQRFVGESRDVLAFAALFFIAIWAANKGRLQAHKRLMLIAALNLIHPAFTRVSFILDLPMMTGLLLPITAWIVVPILYDMFTIRRIHRATIAGILFTLISFILMVAFVVSPLMQYVVSWFPES